MSKEPYSLFIIYALYTRIMSGLVRDVADLGSKFYPVYELYSVAIHLFQKVSKNGD